MTMTPEELRKMVAAATPGPWTAASPDHPEQGFFGCGYRLAKMTGGEIHRDRANAALASQAPTIAIALADALDLLAKVERDLEGRNREMLSMEQLSLERLARAEAAEAERDRLRTAQGAAGVLLAESAPSMKDDHIAALRALAQETTP
jgi:hypothetical protein